MKTAEELKQWMIDQRPNGIDAIKAIQSDAIQGTIPAEELKPVLEFLIDVTWWTCAPSEIDLEAAKEALNHLQSLIHRADSPKGPA